MSRGGVVLVNLAKDWFGPNGVLYECEDNPHEFPADWAEKADPKKIEAKKTKEVTTVEVSEQDSEQKYAVLPSTAVIVESQATVAVDFNTGGGQKVTMPVAVEDDVKRVGGALGEHGLEEPDQAVPAAAKVAKDTGLDQVGGKPRESGPLPAGEKKVK
jgi:hypothetical protein